MRTATDFDGVFPLEQEIQPRIIISGRSYLRFDETKDDIVKYGYNPAEFCILLAPVEIESVVSSALWKAENINNLGIEVFYEDHLLIAFFLKQACPSTHIEVISNDQFNHTIIHEKFAHQKSYRMLFNSDHR